MAKSKSAGSGAEKVKPSVIETPVKKTTSKCTWEGTLSAFGLMTLPVKAYKATDTDKIERNMYHSADCMNRLKQQSMVCSGCNAEVAESTAVMAVTVGDKVVTLSDEEIASCAPVKDRLITIQKFIPADTVDVKYYESGEYLACSAGTPAIEQVFVDFREGLLLSGQVAIGRVVQRNHEYFVAIRPDGKDLFMSYLYAEYEVRQCTKGSTLPANAANAQTFAGLMTSDDWSSAKFEPAPYDSMLKNVRQLIVAKSKGEKASEVKVSGTPAAQPDMMAAMKEMLKQAKSKGKGKAAGKH